MTLFRCGSILVPKSLKAINHLCEKDENGGINDRKLSKNRWIILLAVELE